MVDLKKRSKSERVWAPKGQGYDLNYFATKHGITLEEARNILKRVGNNREKLNAAAARIGRRCDRPSD